MSDTIEIGRQESRLRRNLKRGLAVGAAATALAAIGFRMNHQAGPSADEPKQPAETPELYLRLDDEGHQLAFSKIGSHVLAVEQSGRFRFVNSTHPAAVRFDSLHCEAQALHGGLVATLKRYEPLTTYLVFDIELPENSLSGDCQPGQGLPDVHDGELTIAGRTYSYSLQ
jgi:hypothetical protein